MTTIVLATQNPGKIREMRALLGESGISILGLSELGRSFDEPEETGTTFLANATIKAQAYAQATGHWCLVDDSGLEVDALGGAPGVISSHYAFGGETQGQAAAMTREQRDAKNIERLLADLEGIAPENRTARFVCTMVLAKPIPLPSRAGLQPASSLSPLPPTQTYDGQLRRHQRRLPHLQLAGSTYFITFRLQDGALSEPERRIILDAIKHWHGKRFELDEAVVMPDHVHLIIRPLQQPDGSWPTLPTLIGGIKSFSAKAINATRKTEGSIWQREYFDRIIRDQDELDEKRLYIRNNPVKNGLCEQVMDYPFRTDGRLQAGPTQTKAQDGILAITTGTFEGRIGVPGDVPRGIGGFGYDPIFLIAPEYTIASSELMPEKKNALSHRGQAVRAMVEHLTAFNNP